MINGDLLESRDELESQIERDARGEDPEVDDLTGEEGATTEVRYNITSYGSDLEVEILVKRVEEGTYIIPDYQRGYVWTITRASQFIESLLLGLPVPGIFLYRDSDSKKFLVLDGHQRLKTLQYFMRRKVFPSNDRTFRLRNVNERFEGLSYDELGDGDSTVLNTSVIHATVIEQVEPRETEKTSIYHIFRRINSGAVPLSPHEIRYCVSYGDLARSIKKWNGNEDWRAMLGPVSARMKDQELILRFFALYFSRNEYTEPMQGFLDQFLDDHKNATEIRGQSLEKLFADTVGAVRGVLGDRALRLERAVNAALTDAVLVAVAVGLGAGTLKEGEEFAAGYQALLQDEDLLGAVGKATARKDNVKTRIAKALSYLTTEPE